MSFNAENLQSKLSQVTETQDSITGTSQWILFHKRHAAQSAETWAKFVIEAPENLKLGLVYVANEVVQQAKNKKRDAFVEAWAQVLPDAIGQVYSQVPSAVQDRITRVVKVWRDRKVFGQETLQQIESGTSSGSFFTPTQPSLPVELQPLVKQWPQKLQKPSIEAAQAQLKALDSIEKQFAEIVGARRSAIEQIIAEMDEPEEPSPAIEADSEPEVYTATSAQHEEEDEEEPKRPKMDLDPKLMSFLANMK